MNNEGTFLKWFLIGVIMTLVIVIVIKKYS